MPEVWRVYESCARRFDRERGRSLMERGYLSVLTARLRQRSPVLDLGCGGGEPIARYLIESGFEVVGVDAAPAMIAICRERFPQATWLVTDMTRLELDREFDAVVAWDSFFHLDQDEQRRMFAVFARHTATGGRLLFTSGAEAGIAYGDMFGQPLFHASLAPGEYRKMLAAHGFRVVRYCENGAECGFHTVWLAERE